MRGQTGETGANAQIYAKAANLPPSPPLVSFCIGSQKDFLTLALTESHLFSCIFIFTDNEEELITKKFSFSTETVDNFFTTKALFWGHQQKTRRKKEKTKELQYTKISIVFLLFNKHFMRKANLNLHVARSPKVNIFYH